MKEREPEMIRLRKRVEGRRAKLAAKTSGPGAGSIATGKSASPQSVSEGSVKSRPAGAARPEQRGGVAVAAREETGGDSQHGGTHDSDSQHDDSRASDGRSVVTEPEAGRPTIKLSGVGSHSIGVRPLSEGAAKRPQPKHKPRSQRKK